MKPLPIVLAAAAATAALAATTASGQSSAAPAARTFSTTQVPSASAYVDTGKHGDSPGDILSFVQRLKEDGKPAGTATVTAIAAGHGGRALEFTATVRLAQGSVTLAGLNAGVHEFALPIVGGTGMYAGARGVASITDRDSGPGTIVLSFAS